MILCTDEEWAQLLTDIRPLHENLKYADDEPAIEQAPRILWHGRRRKKPVTGIFDSWNIWLPQAQHFGKHYIKIVLWDSLEEMHKHISADDGTSLFVALHRPEPYFINEKSKKRKFKAHISTIHLVKDRWTLEQAAHELLHFVFHLGKVEKALSQIEHHHMEAYEEPYCYLYGQLFEQLYRDLWQRNQYGKHKEGEQQ